MGHTLICTLFVLAIWLGLGFIAWAIVRGGSLKGRDEFRPDWAGYRQGFEDGRAESDTPGKGSGS